jgi:hypothetical protein
MWATVIAMYSLSIFILKLLVRTSLYRIPLQPSHVSHSANWQLVLWMFYAADFVAILSSLFVPGWSLKRIAYLLCWKII